MSASADAIKALLLADTVVLNPPTNKLIDGGVVTWQETGRNGVSPTSTPDLFENGYLKTVIVIKDDGESAFGGVRDRGAKALSTRLRIQIWFLQDGDDGYEELDTARRRVYDLLHETILAGIGTVKWIGELEPPPDSSLENAAVLRSDYAVFRVRG